MKKRCEPCWDLGAKHSSRGSSKYKGEAAVGLVCSWRSKEASVTMGLCMKGE